MFSSPLQIVLFSNELYRLSMNIPCRIIVIKFQKLKVKVILIKSNAFNQTVFKPRVVLIIRLCQIFGFVAAFSNSLHNKMRFGCFLGSKAHGKNAVPHNRNHNCNNGKFYYIPRPRVLIIIIFRHKTPPLTVFFSNEKGTAGRCRARR